MKDERLTEEQIADLISDVSHWGDDYSETLLRALRELQAARAEIAAKDTEIARLERGTKLLRTI